MVVVAGWRVCCGRRLASGWRNCAFKAEILPLFPVEQKPPRGREEPRSPFPGIRRALSCSGGGNAVVRLRELPGGPQSARGLQPCPFRGCYLIYYAPFIGAWVEDLRRTEGLCWKWEWNLKRNIWHCPFTNHSIDQLSSPIRFFLLKKLQDICKIQESTGN